MSAWMLFVVTLLPPPDPTTKCAEVERNVVLTSEGGIRIDQYIFWENSEDLGVRVRDWVVDVNCEQRMRRWNGNWVGWFWDRSRSCLVRVECKRHYQTVSFEDHEVEDREILEVRCRTGLRKRR